VTVKKPNPKNPNLVAFQLDEATIAKLLALAQENNFPSVSTYARARLRDSLQQAPDDIALDEVTELRNQIKIRILADVVRLFNGYTADDFK
jgi:hypothetical protein